MAIAEWTSEAVADLEKVVDYIAQQANRRSVARDVYDAIRRHCNDYATLIEGGNILGTSCPDLGAEVRLITHQRWVILFRPYKNTIEVLAVFDGSREYEKVLEDRS